MQSRKEEPMFNEWQYKGLKLLSAATCKLSYKNIQRVGRFLAPFYRLVGHKQRTRAIEHVMRAYNINAKEAAKIVDVLFTHLTTTIVEILYMPRLTKEFIRENIEVKGLEYMEEAYAEDKGVIVLTAHVGNWEWMGATMASFGYPTTTIVKNQPNAQFTRFINEYREMVGLEVFARDGADIVKAARAMKKKKILGFLADQDGWVQGYPVPFLGEMSSAPLGPATFARRFKAPVLPVFTYRKPEGGHVVEIQKPFYYEDTGHPNHDMYKLTEKCVQITEEFINKHPTEWLWFQYRWKTKLEEIENWQEKLTYREMPDEAK